MTLEQFFATHRAPNAIVIPQTDRRGAAELGQHSLRLRPVRAAPGDGEKH